MPEGAMPPAAARGDAPLLEVTDLAKHYPVERGVVFSRRLGTVRAVDGVSFSLHRGETLGLVGESGCGKSTTARLVLRLIPPTRGQIRFNGQDITALSGEELRRLRRRIQVVFQDPFASLDPRMRVFDILAEPLRVHGIGNEASRRRRVEELLRLVGLSSYHASRYPHEFSGGQRQRVGIARALAPNPDLIICDEPVSALDVSIQAQVVNLLGDLKRDLGLSYLFIAHDLAVVKHVADRIAVMYLGRIVEIATKDALFTDPIHPYTRMLLAAIPRPDPHHKTTPPETGAMPSPIDPPSGCRFHTRCPFAIARCREEDPALLEVKPGHFVACHRWAELPPALLEANATALSAIAARRLALYEQRSRSS